MVLYEEINKAVKKLDKTFKFVNLRDMEAFITEQTVTKKGRYKVRLEFDAKDVLFNPESIPRRPSDYRYRPLLLIIQQDWDKIKGKKKDKIF